ncbi:von willebrand domain-containing [Pyrenophora seminiperda CCB06]|uniref:von willebrand domain-containing n=1 Tax=Pyrenophora seminiperda CCB06 TaxID=1302712 RepID=A0A3M7MGZ3_9PLEO|nr:von willebrand domain-containing [Pyrenophora seminiperda CCB06]
MYQHPSGREYMSGLYYWGQFNGQRQEKNFLPQVQMEAHATILAITSRTVLTQTFVNPSTDKGIRECRYMFPLYDGVSVVGFTCYVGDRTIVGQVKENEKARAVFQEATARGEMAGLLEQLPEASDVFTTTVGNIPPGARVVIKITYLGELKHDLEVDGIRFTIPTIICPRYGSYPGVLRRTPATNAMGGSISITVDAEMADGSFIQKIQSPTHLIAMTMGTTSVAPNAEPIMTKASATLTLGTAELETDFVVQIIAKNTGVPKAIIENHATIANHRALMATLVPKFSLPPEKPEIVFVCDRSGSMQETRIALARQALQVFLKSLPVGVKFNICSFGNYHSFLWPKSVTYSQQTLDTAINHVSNFAADYGGTEILQPLRATIENRYKDMALDIMLLTDGEIWHQQELFSYLNQSVLESKDPIRVFTLGVGNGVSHSLIEGIAKAGNGFSQAVGEGEKMDTKVVRMLKGALSPHITDYTLEVKYSNKDASSTIASEDGFDDDFEIIEKVADSLKVKLDLSEEKSNLKKSVGLKPPILYSISADNEQKTPISLFDPTANLDDEISIPHDDDDTGEQRYAHLPSIPTPKILQAPQQIPSLFAFNRTTVYLLLGPNAPQANPQSVILRGSSAHGPLELEIPIRVLDKPGETLHQLAAKKAISELEQGRGWTLQAKDESDILIKTKFEGRYEDIVEREAVRLGVQFQVGGKWCSFVAVEAKKNNAAVDGQTDRTKGWEWLDDEPPAPAQNPFLQTYGLGPMNQPLQTPFASQGLFGSPLQDSGYSGGNTLTMFGTASTASPYVAQIAQQQQQASFGNNSTGLFGATASNNHNATPFGSFGQATPAAPSTNSLFGFGSSGPPLQQQQRKISSFSNQLNGGLFGATRSVSSSVTPFGQANQGPSRTGGLFAGSPSPPSVGVSNQPSAQDTSPSHMPQQQQQQQIPNALPPPPPPPASSSPPVPTAAPLTGEPLLHHLISLQTFSGSWALSPSLIASIGLDSHLVESHVLSAGGVPEEAFATALVLACFEKWLREWEGSWELVADKAREYLQGVVGGRERADEVVRGVVGGLFFWGGGGGGGVYSMRDL